MIRLIPIIVAVLLAGTAMADRYVGYYYPEVSSEEVLIGSSARRHSKPGRAGGFVNILTSSQLDAPESPRYLFLAKGDEAETLILTALDDQVFATIYRARAILAQLTVNVRMGNFFRQEDLQYVATFFDLLQMMEFDELLITDGATWTHRVTFNR